MVLFIVRQTPLANLIRKNEMKMNIGDFDC